MYVYRQTYHVLMFVDAVRIVAGDKAFVCLLSLSPADKPPQPDRRNPIAYDAMRCDAIIDPDLLPTPQVYSEIKTRPPN